MLIGVKEYVKLKRNSVSYAGRFEGKQEFVLDPLDTATESFLERDPMPHRSSHWRHCCL